MSRCQHDYEVIFVDDGSTDNTLEIIERFSEENSKINYISLSRNFGHQMALKAGLDHADGDCVVSMDADMQHPPEIIERMIQKWQQGYEVVYTIRKQSRQLPFIKRGTSKLFYGLMSLLAQIRIEKGAADFRLMDKSVIEVFKNITESSLFVRGMVSWMGFKQCSINYVPNDRYAGLTKYSMKKMLSFALDGITSFSIRPLRLATVLGIAISGLSFLYGIYALIMYVFTDRAILGWTSVLGSVLFIGGLQLLMLGIFGEYLGKLFIESKKRPTYIIRKKNL